jgi:hypothetical protein
MSRVVLVLTLSIASREGHRPYRSQSDNPLQGTTLGGSADDPRRQRTRNAPAGHAARAGARQRQRGLPGAGDLAHPVLPVAQTLRTVWGRRGASAAAGRPPRSARAGAGGDRAAGAQRGHQHGDASEPGELVCLDTFYIGNLKGVGKVWQITACDAASSYGVAALLPTHTAAEAATFLRDVLVPLFRRAGWPLRRVLTDGGPEFNGAFDGPVGSSACATPAPSRAMPGPTDSSSACRARSSKSTGASPSGVATSPAARRCSGRSRASCATTTTSDRIKATGSEARRPRRSSGVRSRAELMDGSGTTNVSTPFRTWTR